MLMKAYINEWMSKTVILRDTSILKEEWLDWSNLSCPWVSEGILQSGYFTEIFEVVDVIATKLDYKFKGKIQ